MAIINDFLKIKPFSRLIVRAYLCTSKGKKKYSEFVKESKIYSNIPDDANIKSMYLQFVYLRNLSGFTEKDYFLYELFKRDDKEIDKYISERRRCEMYDYADDKAFNHIMGDKKDFFDVYSKYMQPYVVFCISENDYEHFMDLVNGQNSIIVKPRDGQRGQGVELLSVSSEKSKEKVWRKCLSEKLIAERVLSNDQSIACFHPESLNTIRISTVMDLKGEVHICAASLRTGSGNNYVDNGSHEGIYAAIDTNTGIVCSNGCNGRGQVFESHPDTHLSFKGTHIPDWDDLIILVKEIADITKQLRYIGWDFVYTTNKKWILLEGNEPGGVHILQQPLGYGLYPLYSKLIYGSNKEG